MKTKAFFLFLAVLFLGSAFGASAFTFEPISADFQPSGPGARVSFRVENTTLQPIAVQVSVLTREMDSDGNETRNDASSLFQIYPVQMVLQPGQYQIVRIQWRGESSLSIERPFRIVAEQLPVNFQAANTVGGAINILYRYIGTLYVVPRTLVPDVVVESAAIVDDNGVRRLRMVLLNRGNAHILMDRLTVRVVSRRNGTVVSDLVLPTEQLAGMTGENMLAGLRRSFTVPCPEAMQEGDLEATLSFVPAR